MLSVLCIYRHIAYLALRSSQANLLIWFLCIHRQNNRVAPNTDSSADATRAVALLLLFVTKNLFAYLAFCCSQMGKMVGSLIMKVNNSFLPTIPHKTNAKPLTLENKKVMVNRVGIEPTLAD